MPLSLTDLPEDAVEHMVRFARARDQLALAHACTSSVVVTTKVGLQNFQAVFQTRQVPGYLLKSRSDLFRLVERARQKGRQEKEVFTWAAAFGFTEFLRRALANAEDPQALLEAKHAVEPKSESALCAAVKTHDGDIVELLLKHGAGVGRAVVSKDKEE